MLAPSSAGGPVLGFQKVPEERAGKNRLHLDLVAPVGERHAEVERLVGLGATVLGERGGDAEGFRLDHADGPGGQRVLRRGALTARRRVGDAGGMPAGAGCAGL